MHVFSIKELQVALGIVSKVLDVRKESPKLKSENIGCIPEQFCQPLQAIEFYNILLRTAEKLRDKKEAGRANAILGNAYNNAGQYKSAIDCYRKHFEFADEVGDKINMGRAQENLGNAYQCIDQYQEAITCYNIQLDIAEKLGDKTNVGRAFSNLGNAYDTIGQYQKAITYINKQLEIAEIMEDKASVGRANANLGNAYDSIGEHQKAVDCHLKDLAISEDLEDKEGVVRAQGNLGIAYQNIGEYQMAIDVHHRCLKAAEVLGDNASIGHANGHLGIAYHSLGQYQEAIDFHHKDLKIAEELRNKDGLERAHANLGNVYQSIGQYHLALDCYRKYLEISEEGGNPLSIGHAQESLGNAYESINQYEKAIECRRKHLEIAKELGDKAELGRAYVNIGNLLQNIGEYNQAIECHRKDLEIAEELGDRQRSGLAHGNLGNAYNNIGEHQNAIDCHCRQLKIAEELGDKQSLGMAYGNLGNTYQTTDQYEKAISCFRKHLEIAEELGDSAGEAHAQESLGNAYQSIGHYQQAIESYGNHLALAEEMEDMSAIGRACTSLGDAYNSKGLYNKAIDCYSRSLNIAKELQDSERAGKANEGLGKAYDNIGQFKNSFECHREHLKISKDLGDLEGEGTALGNLGNTYRSLGHYQKAIDCQLENLKIAETLEDKEEVGNAHSNLGSTYQRIGLYQMAIDCHLRHLKIAKELGDTCGEGCAQGNLGNSYQSIGEYDKALEYQLKDLKIAEELGDRLAVGMAYGNLGNTYDIIGQRQKAIECHSKHLAIAEELGDAAGAGSAYGNLGNAYCRIFQYQKAIDCHGKHLEIAEQIGDIRGVASAQSSLGECYQKRGDNNLACSFFAKSILSYHNIRCSNIYEDEFNMSMSNIYAIVHKWLFESLLNMNQVKAALLVSDGGKAKALYDLTRKSVDVILDSTFDDIYFTQIKAISIKPCSIENEAHFDTALSKLIDFMQDGSIISYTFDEHNVLHSWVISRKGVFHKQWQTTNGMSSKNYLSMINREVHESFTIYQQVNVVPQSVVDSFEKKCDREGKEEFSNKKEHENSFPRDLEDWAQNLTLINRSLESQNCDREISADKRFVEIYNLDSPTINQDGLHFRETFKFGQANGRSFEKVCGRYSLDLPRAIPVGDSASITRSPGLQYNAGTEDLLRKQYSIYIAPIKEYLLGSKILFAPEGSLFKVPFCALLDSKNEALCNTYSLQFTPSLQVLNSSLLKPLPKLGHALFVGNPIVGTVTFCNKQESICQLPNAATEAKECSQYFKSKPLLEEKATKENVLKNMKDASIIHIAAHGHPDHADIFLAPNEGAPKPPCEQDYLLTAKDLVNCTLKSRLVVLSCCFSGRGKISAEGVVGIARSFLGAGARSVLVALWRITDASTMEFMKLFYDRVCQGLSVCVALQQSMIELKKKYSMRAWAPFQIVGEDIAFTQPDIKEIRRQCSQRFRLASLRPPQPRFGSNSSPYRSVSGNSKINSLLQSLSGDTVVKQSHSSLSTVRSQKRQNLYHSNECAPKELIKDLCAKQKMSSLQQKPSKQTALSKLPTTPSKLKEKQKGDQEKTPSSSKLKKSASLRCRKNDLISESDKRPSRKRNCNDRPPIDLPQKKKAKQQATVLTSSKSNSFYLVDQVPKQGITRKAAKREQRFQEGCGEGRSRKTQTVSRRDIKVRNSPRKHT